MIIYRATLDVSRELVRHVARLLWAERRRRATPKGSRALTCFWLAVLVLRWFRDHTDPTALGRDHDISRATAYRYIDEVIEVLAAQAPDLHAALQRAKNDGLPHLITDRTIITSESAPVTHPPQKGLARETSLVVITTSEDSDPLTGSRRPAPATASDGVFISNKMTPTFSMF